MFGVSQTRCGVVPGFFGVLVQGVLFSTSVLALFVKYHTHESKKELVRRRSRARFVFDSSKQIAGSCLIHVMNLYLSVNLQGDHTDECSWYWIEIMVDTTIGVGVEAAINELVEMAVKLADPNSGHLQFLKATCVVPQKNETDAHDAQRPHPPPKWMQCELNVPNVGVVYWAVYLFQLAHWLLIVIIMKLFMLLFMLLFRRHLASAASTVLSNLQSHPKVKLVFVMLFTPTVMNAVQYWLQDEILVRISKSGKKNSHETADTTALLDHDHLPEGEKETKSPEA